MLFICPVILRMVLSCNVSVLIVWFCVNVFHLYVSLLFSVLCLSFVCVFIWAVLPEVKWLID